MADSPESETFRPLPPPASLVKATLNLMPDLASSFSSGPKNETARITVPPKPPAAVITSREARSSTVSVPLCWILFGASAATLLIQIWNYIS